MSRVYLVCNNDYTQMDLCKFGQWFSCRVRNTKQDKEQYFNEAASTFYKMLVKWNFTCVSKESLKTDYLMEAYKRFQQDQSNKSSICFDLYPDDLYS